MKAIVSFVLFLVLHILPSRIYLSMLLNERHFTVRFRSIIHFILNATAPKNAVWWNFPLHP